MATWTSKTDYTDKVLAADWNALQTLKADIKKATAANLGTLDSGELGLETDTRRVLIGSSMGNQVIKGDYVTPEMYGAVGDGVTDDHVAIESACAVGGNLVFADKTYLIDDDITIPVGTTIEFVNGGMLSVATGHTVTIRGSVRAGLHQIFSCLGTGKVVFSPPWTTEQYGSITEVYPEWWKTNTLPGYTDMTTAMQAAIDAVSLGRGGEIRLSTRYLISSTLNIIDAHSLTIRGMGTTAYTPYHQGTSIIYLGASAAIKIYGSQQTRLSDFSVAGPPAAYAAGGFGIIISSDNDPVSVNTQLDRVNVRDFETGVLIGAMGNAITNYQVDGIGINAGSIIGCKYGIYLDSSNSLAILIKNTRFVLNDTDIYARRSDQFTLLNCDAGTQMTGGTYNSFIYVPADSTGHGTITAIGCHVENVDYLIRRESIISLPINIIGGTFGNIIKTGVTGETDQGNINLIGCGVWDGAVFNLNGLNSTVTLRDSQITGDTLVVNLNGIDTRFIDDSNGWAVALTVNKTGANARVISTNHALVGQLLDIIKATAACVVKDWNKTILGDATAGAFNVTLPDPVHSLGSKVSISKVDVSANAITVNVAAGGLINGVATYSLPNQYNKVTVICTGIEWIIQ